MIEKLIISLKKNRENLKIPTFPNVYQVQMIIFRRNPIFIDNFTDNTILNLYIYNSSMYNYQQYLQN